MPLLQLHRRGPCRVSPSIPYTGTGPCQTPGMASYAVVSGLNIATGEDGVLAVVVTDGQETIVVPAAVGAYRLVGVGKVVKAFVR